MKLLTDRLILREFKKSDVKDITKNIGNINVSKWLLVVPYPYVLKDANFWVNKCLEQQNKKDRDKYDFAIELKEEEKIIGGIGLNKVDKSQGLATIGYWIGEKYWRKGYGTEALREVLKFAFNKLKLRRIEAEVFYGNSPSGKLLELFGFKKEGYKRKAVRCKADKKIKDAVIYGLLKEEWKK